MRRVGSAGSVGMSNETNEQNEPLPQPTGGSEVGGSESAPEQPFSAPIVLVVEDDAITRKAVGRKLQAAGYEVVLVPSAADALIVAQRMEFHVLVLDLHLPDMTDPFNGIYEGFAMLDWLHRQVGDFKFRIVVHTSQRSVQILQRADEHGVFAVCNKRRDFTNLLQSVAQAVESLKPKAA